jgi:PAS domain-containing protein
MRHIDTAPEYEPWRQAALERGFRSSAALPLRYEGKVLGVLNVYSDSPDAFVIEEVGLLQEVADHLAYALASIRTEERCERAERRLREMRHARAAFHRLPFAVLVTDASGLIVAANRPTTELLSGYTRPEELVEKVKMEKLELFDEVDLQPLLGKVLEARRSAEECFAVTVDGRELSLLCRGLPVVDEEGELTEAVWILKEAETSPLPGE